LIKKELYIIRHGETDFNRQGIVQGRGVNTSLNTLGKEQARLFYEAYKNEGFELVCTSTLKRSIETVKLFVEDGIPTKSFSALDEISWGNFEGQPATLGFKKSYHQLLKLWNEGNADATIENCETITEVQIRQQSFLDRVPNWDYKKILICMHGRAMRIMLATMLKVPIQKMDQFGHHNLSLYKLLFENEKYTIEIFNSLAHLHEKN
jgi:broad specificity phosphatase PhoE